MRRIRIAQIEAAIPMKAIILFPSRGCLKSRRVILNTIKPNAKKTNMLVNIFIK
jgi:hypothetical protein